MECNESGRKVALLFARNLLGDTSDAGLFAFGGSDRGTTDAVVLESSLTHLCQREHVSAIDDDRIAQRFFYPCEIEFRKLCPIGENQKSFRILTGVIRRS